MSADNSDSHSIAQTVALSSASPAAEREPKSSASSRTEDRPRGGDSTPEVGEGRFGEALEEHRKKHKGLLPESWRVRLPIFQGPLDLLLHLIRVNEVDITDIPVALICDQYHEYLELMEDLDLDVAGEYIYEAAILIQLKSRLLLPRPKLEEGEEPPQDPRTELVERLLEYQRLKDAAQTLAEVSSLRSGLLTREWQELRGPADDDRELEVGDLSLFDLLKVFKMTRMDKLFKLADDEKKLAKIIA